MGRIIVRVGGIDRRHDRLIRVGIGLLGEIRVGIPAGVVLGEVQAVLAEIPVGTGLREMLAGGGLVETREEGMLGIVLEIRGEQRRAIREGIDPVVGMPELDLAGQRLEIPVGVARAEIQVGMREGVDLQPVTHGLHGILTRDFLREAIGHRRSHNHDHSHNRGHNLSLSNGLSQGRSRRARDRVGSVEITMPERRGRRAIAVEPVPVAVAETGEVETNEIARVDVWIDRCGSGGFWLASFAGAECGSEDVPYVSRGGEGICDGGEGE
jgi:hypothetical protein